MTLAEDGPLLIALERAKAMLAATDVWQEISATNKIHFDALPPGAGPNFTKAELIAARPFAILWNDTSGGFRLKVATTDMRCGVASGRIVCQFELNVPSERKSNPNTLGEYLARTIGRLIQTGDAANPGLWELSNLPGYLPLKEIEVSNYIRTNAKEQTELGDAVVFELVMHWGKD